MKQHTRITIAFSLLFFSFFVFTNLTLFISQFSHSFSHLFLIFIRENQLFDHLSTFFFFCGFILSSAFVILSSWYQLGNALQRIMVLILGVVFIYIVILKITYVPETEDIMDMFAIEGSIYHRSFFELVIDYLPRIVILSCTYIFFVYLPLLFEIFSLRPNQNSQLGKALYNMRPSINVVVVMLFGLALQPYYYRDNLYAYFDVIALFVGVGLLIWVIIKHREFFSFYEYVNCILLMLGILICFVCTSVLSVSDNYFNARYAFLVLGFIGWCVEWMYENLGLVEEE